MKVERSVKLFNEVITYDNVEPMSEIIALYETKYLITYISTPMIKMHNNLVRDIYHKNECNYAVSDGYDLVQQVALLLCQNIGKKLNDLHHIDKKGRKITIQMQAAREISKLVNHKFSRIRQHISLETVNENIMPEVELKESVIEENYDIVDSIISNLGLNETQLTALECRMNGMSYPEISKVIQRAVSTTYDLLRAVEKRYTAIYF